MSKHDCITAERKELMKGVPSIISIRFDLSTIVSYNGNKTSEPKTGTRVWVRYNKKNRKGETVEKVEKTFVTHVFCPFCGKKYNNNVK